MTGEGDDHVAAGTAPDAGVPTRRRLTPQARKLLPAEHARALQRQWTGKYSSRPTWTVRRPPFGAWNAALRDRLPVPRVKLPGDAEEHAAWALGVSPLHAPVLAGAALLASTPGWRESLATSVRAASAARKAATLTLDDRGWSHEAWQLAIIAGAPPQTSHSAAAVSGVLAAATAVLPLFDEAPPAEASDHLCRVCGRAYAADSITADLVFFTGSLDYCHWCATGAREGDGFGPAADERWRKAAVWAVAELAVEFGGPPSRTQVSDVALPPGPADELRDKALMLRQLLPEQRSAWKRPSWTALLGEAGLLEGGLRRARGVVSVAADGHLCTSMLERSIDDFLHVNGIEHEKEPRYPAHPVLNPNYSRADWLLPDGTYVEAAGMLGVASYAEKMQRKHTLVSELGLRLIVVTPTDLTRLRTVFAAHLPRCTEPR